MAKYGFVLVLLVSGCGFKPLYDARQDDNVSVSAFQAIYVAPIKERLGTMLRTEIRRALGEKKGNIVNRYTLELDVVESTQGLGVRKDATATRANLIVRASALLKNADNEQMMSAQFVSRNSYNLLTETYATVEARRDAQRRGVQDLAQQIRAHLAVYFLRQSQDDGENQSQRR